MTSPVLSFRAEEALVEALDQLASATGHDRQYHLERALAGYVEAEFLYIKAVEEGLADIEAGKTIKLEAVKAKWVALAANRAE